MLAAPFQRPTFPYCSTADWVAGHPIEKAAGAFAKGISVERTHPIAGISRMQSERTIDCITYR